LPGAAGAAALALAAAAAADDELSALNGGAAATATNAATPIILNVDIFVILRLPKSCAPMNGSDSITYVIALIGDE
jgi:hypothetical protein